MNCSNRTKHTTIMGITMKYNEFKESLKKKAQNIREIKIGLKEAQRQFHFNSYSNQGIPMGWEIFMDDSQTPEQRKRAEQAYKDLTRCTVSEAKAIFDYRARHIAISLFRGKTPEQIENNYYDGKWSDVPCWGKYLEDEIERHLKQLKLDNPVREEELAEAV